MRKNVVLACGLGDMFTFLTRLDDFFEKNPDYDSIKFWTWLHTPDLARELVSLTEHDVEIFTVADMVDFLERHIPSQRIESAREHFVKQHPGGIGVDKYVSFVNTFFPNIEQWVYLPVYEKYATTYPYRLSVQPAKRERKYIIVHPFSTTVKTEKPERTWSPARWGNLLTQMVRYYSSYEVVLIGGPKDKVEGKRDFPTNITDLRGKTSLTEAISLIYGASAVAGTNSWSTSMSAWAGIPTYAQWFVQHQLIPSHYPMDPKKMDHLHLDVSDKHPTADVAFAGVRKVFDAALTI